MTNIKYIVNFHKKFKKLNKKNKNLINDVKKLVSVLEENPTSGTLLGNNIYKIRMANSSKNIGKRGGFRVITYYIDKNDILYLIEIYEKSSIENISIEQLTKLIEETVI